jgi:hypothetical protein
MNSKVLTGMTQPEPGCIMKIFDTDRAKHVLVELIRAAGGEWTGKTRLYKGYYLAHLYYAETEPDYLTNWPVVKMPYGPGIECGDELLNQLVLSGVLAREHTLIGPYTGTVYRLTGKPLPGESLSLQAVRAIELAVNFVREKGAAELSDLTHEFSRSWNSAQEGQELNIYVDPIPDDEFAARDQRLSTLKSELTAAWNAAQ